MELEGNTVLVTGGGSGIGRGVAETLHRLGNRVVIAGRRHDALQAVTAANPGMHHCHLDVADSRSIAQLAATLRERHPTLNVLINNAGVMRTEDLLVQGPSPIDIAGITVATNLLGPMRLTAALLPVLLERPHAAIVNVTSALAFVPKAAAPTYSATKAGMHAYTQSLRRQLRDTAIQVIEVIPPQVHTDMLDSCDPGPEVMPLHAYLAQTFALWSDHPHTREIVVDSARRLRFAAHDGHYDDVFDHVNP